jgi:hypothetical protein
MLPLRATPIEFPVAGRTLRMLRAGCNPLLIRGADLRAGRLELLRAIPRPRLGPFAKTDGAAVTRIAARMHQVLIERDMIGSFSRMRVFGVLLIPHCLLFGGDWLL